MGKLLRLRLLVCCVHEMGFKVGLGQGGRVGRRGAIEHGTAWYYSSVPCKVQLASVGRFLEGGKWN
jgi:hypothetical protein